jgi:hypothetical protein
LKPTEARATRHCQKRGQRDKFCISFENAAVFHDSLGDARMVHKWQTIGRRLADT